MVLVPFESKRSSKCRDAVEGLMCPRIVRDLPAQEIVIRPPL